jgi:P-type Na+/K+ transporter
MLVYGLWIAALCLASFTLVLYGWGDGNLGVNCNESLYNEFGEPVCRTVFRARATTFACLTWFSLFLAWEMIDLRRSFFAMHPGTKTPYTQWMRDVWSNRFLFWSIIAGFVTIFPVIYIPVINEKVFRHTRISWEWAIVFINAGLFFVGVEGWKCAKRVFYRRRHGRTETVQMPRMDSDETAYEKA